MLLNLNSFGGSVPHVAPPLKVNMKEAEMHFALMGEFMTSYEQLVGGKVANNDMTYEDYDQVDYDDLEIMELKWSMAMIVRKINKFTQRIGKYMQAMHKRTGFQKLRVICYNCQEFGHFAKECDKPKKRVFFFTKDSR